MRITTHVEDALARLPEDYRQPVRQALLTALVRPLEELEQAAYDMTLWRDLATAAGVQLDVLGAILALPRAALSDEDYRRLLRVQILILHSDGLPEALLTILRGWLNIKPGHLVYREFPPAGWVIYYDTATTLQRQIGSVLGRSKAAGVRGALISATTAPTATFRLAWGSTGYGAGYSSYFDVEVPSGLPLATATEARR